MQTENKVEIIKKALEDKKADDIVILNIGKVSTIADFFIIATGNNPNQMQALADNVEQKAAENKISNRGIEGYSEDASWILMDYDDVIVHIFSRESRQFFNLEKIWKDAEIC